MFSHTPDQMHHMTHNITYAMGLACSMPSRSSIILHSNVKRPQAHGFWVCEREKHKTKLTTKHAENKYRTHKHTYRDRTNSSDVNPRTTHCQHPLLHPRTHRLHTYTRNAGETFISPSVQGRHGHELLQHKDGYRHLTRKRTRQQRSVYLRCGQSGWTLRPGQSSGCGWFLRTLRTLGSKLSGGNETGTRNCRRAPRCR